MKFQLYKPLKPSINYPDNFYNRTKNGFPVSIVSQFFGENLACKYPDGSWARWPTPERTCPLGSTSVYVEMGMLGHNGLDIPCRRGDKIYAAHNGTISRVEVDSAGGWGVRILTNEVYEWNGKPCRFETLYWHILPNPPVKEGQVVEYGDLIAFADPTGLSSGDHLHFGLKPKSLDGLTNLAQNNQMFGAIDPLPYLVEEFANETNEKVKSLYIKIIEIYRQIVAMYKK